MLQYIVLLIGELSGKVGEAIDTGFANSLSIGAICVFAILGSINNLLRALYEYGAYYYRMYRDRAKAGLLLNIVMSISASILFECFAKYVKYIYYVEPEYEVLLYNCLVISFMYFPFKCINEYLHDYMVYSGRERMMTISVVVYYVFLIAFDAVAVLKYRSAEYILIGTAICDIVSAIILYNISGIRREKFELSDIRKILVDGYPLFYNRLASKISNTLINVFGTRLGSLEYAIVSVSRKTLEVAQVCIYPILPIILIRFKDCVNLTYKKIIKSLNWVTSLSFIIFSLMGFIMTYVVKGSLSIEQLVIPVFACDVTSLVTYYWYLLNEGILMVGHHKKLIKSTGTIRVVVTVLICLFSLIPDIGYWSILLYSTISDVTVAFYGWCKIRKVNYNGDG